MLGAVSPDRGTMLPTRVRYLRLKRSAGVNIANDIGVLSTNIKVGDGSAVS